MFHHSPAVMTSSSPFFMNERLKIILATRNKGKVAEMRAVLAGLPVELLSVSDFPDAPYVEEDQNTLEGNARKKAMAFYRHTGLPALADDTGLEVSALNGQPGVHSARYAGPEAVDSDNRSRLLKELAGITKRDAKFRTIIAFVESEKIRYFKGECAGRILEEERGTGGFGYDALFVPEGEILTFAEMSAEQKNTISHRSRALHKLAVYIANHFPSSPADNRE